VTRLLVDMCVDRRVAAALADSGHDVVHVASIGMATAADAEIMALALEEDRAVVTHDSDFAQLLSRSAAPAPSVIQLRMPTAGYEELAHTLAEALVRLSEDLERGCIASLSPRGIRVHQLPIGGGRQASADE
jgi:predicted nuclease of predicted toxin-antitoxin system